MNYTSPLYTRGVGGGLSVFWRFLVYCVGDVLSNSCFFFTDVIGVCKSADEMTRLTTKTNREVSKRTLNLMDMSGKMVTVTLWGEEVSLVQ